ncbi:hypothetical protein PR001_g221 [Phytophthora rubi]|uniref:Uncharacterized protein n=1 Tax=Phytophthora rubi TaxID=129364 RepID=A0A6A3P3Y9_9STRA|nr:hypothetical protein PR001_g221 [Phytophthora rubi]
MLMYQLIIKLNAHVEQQYMKKAYSKVRLLTVFNIDTSFLQSKKQ